MTKIATFQIYSESDSQLKFVILPYLHEIRKGPKAGRN